MVINSGIRSIFAKQFMCLICLLTVFFYSSFLFADQTTSTTLKVGDKAPFFKVGDFSSKKYFKKKNLTIVFYRGHF